MNLRNIQECERNKLEKWSRFQLPNKWKKIGVGLTFTLLAALLTIKFLDGEATWVRPLLRRLLLVSLLIVSLSKEVTEDEMIASLRGKSYTLAFIIGVVYSLFQPIIDYIIHNFLYEPTNFNGFSYFQVLFFMLLIQILFFEVLKRNR